MVHEQRSTPPTKTLVVMGVSGIGKSTIAAELVARTGWTFAEGDDMHPEANRRAMAAGHPLHDADRWPWLRRVAAWIGEQEDAGRDAIVTCSALKRSYRDLLCEGHPSVTFVHLLAPPELIDARITARRGHFMPESLLASQLATLEPLQPGEPGIEVTATGTPDDIASSALQALGIDPAV
jgi:gluconokinase